MVIFCSIFVILIYTSPSRIFIILVVAIAVAVATAVLVVLLVVLLVAVHVFVTCVEILEYRIQFCLFSSFQTFVTKDQ